jgi:hypothetical protein
MCPRAGSCTRGMSRDLPLAAISFKIVASAQLRTPILTSVEFTHLHTCKIRDSNSPFSLQGFTLGSCLCVCTKCCIAHIFYFSLQYMETRLRTKVGRYEKLGTRLELSSTCQRLPVRAEVPKAALQINDKFSTNWVLVLVNAQPLNLQVEGGYLLEVHAWMRNASCFLTQHMQVLAST